VIVTEACAVEKVHAFAAELGVPVVAVDGEFEGCLAENDGEFDGEFMDATEPLTETKRRGKEERKKKKID